MKLPKRLAAAVCAAALLAGCALPGQERTSVEELLRALTEAEGACVVNNNAAAVLLMLGEKLPEG